MFKLLLLTLQTRRIIFFLPSSCYSVSGTKCLKWTFVNAPVFLPACIPESQKYLILLPKIDHVVNLISIDYHLKLLNASPLLLQASLREKFWIPSTRYAVRRVVRRCTSCFRNSPRFTDHVMGDLPESIV
ncbi:integrase catalytic domain-containing protein [Trichonephila clavipes]|nr:integrase catalytic domain-containing protein [Trichonephila clavipes]